MTGWAASRRIQATALAAAPRVIRVCQRSQVRTTPCPSASGPPPAVNADSMAVRAAVCLASTLSNDFSAVAWVSVGRPAISAAFR